MSRIRCFLFAIALTIVSFAAFAVPVDINKADANTIAQELNGVGATRAEAIVAYREQHGPYQTVDDLLKVKGIGKAIVEKNRDAIVLSSE